MNEEGATLKKSVAGKRDAKRNRAKCAQITALARRSLVSAAESCGDRRPHTSYRHLNLCQDRRSRESLPSFLHLF